MSVFELLCKTNFNDVMEEIYKDGKRKPFCPIRFLTDDQIAEWKERNNEELIDK